MGKKKKGGQGIALLNPKNLQKEIDHYGYSFRMDKYVLSIFLAVAFAIICGIIFSLKIPFILLVAGAAVLCLPAIISYGYRNMYEHKRFLDISDYMDQMLYSFKMSQKILAALKDTLSLCESGKIHTAIQEAVQYIEAGEEKTDLYKEAFELIERQYPSSHLKAVHSYMRAVEKNGGDSDESIDLLLQELAVWSDNTLLLQEEKKNARQKVMISLGVTMILVFTFYMVFGYMPEQYRIMDNLIVQSATSLYLILNILIFKRSNKEIAASWIERQGEQKENQKISTYYKMVKEHQERGAGKKRLLWASPFLIAGIVMAAVGYRYVAAAMVIIGIVMFNQERLGYRLAYNRVVQAINIAFPQWLMQIALLLQEDRNNVQVALEKTIPEAPEILKIELQELLIKLNQNPGAAEPYMEFLQMFHLSFVQSAMKMLYSISEVGSGDAQAQVQVLVQRNNKLLDKSEKIMNEKSLVGVTGLFYLPQLTVSFEILVMMMAFMFQFFTNLNLG